jgi:nucleotide-binding universal stress UspA family protein
MARIAFGVDGSDASKDALRWAIDEGRLRKATVDAVYAWQVPIMPPDVGPSLAPSASALEMTALFPKLEESARLLVEDVVREVAGDQPDVEVRAVPVEGPPANALLDAAQGADLLVVGSRGHGHFKGMLLGSTSLHIVQHSPCPVVVLRHHDKDE